MDCTRRIMWLLSLLLLVSIAEGYSGGAGDSACDTMTPGHPSPGDVGEPPFEITLSQTSYQLGGVINVTLNRTDGNTFDGFLVQARRKGGSDTEKLGTFTSVPGTRYNCGSLCTQWPQCSLTHSNANPKSDVTVTWQAPCTNEGEIEFRATFVQSYSPSVYWRNLSLAALQFDPTPSDACQNVTSTAGPDVTRAPALPPIDLNGCGSSKGCYRAPSNCTSMENCDHLLTWEAKDSQIDFELSAMTTGNTKWTAIGFSMNEKMGSDSVTDCIYDETSGSVIVQSSWNTDAPANEVLADKELGLVEGSTQGSYAGGIVHCAFTRYVNNNQSARSDSRTLMFVPHARAAVDQIYDLDKAFYLFLAKGPATGGVKSPHTELPAISPQQVNVSSTSYVNIGGSNKFELVITHGALMIFAWMLFVSIGVLMPRHFKTAWKDYTFYDKAIWFQIHRPLMILALILTCVAFICIFVEEGGYASHLQNADAAHPILGILVTVLAIANPVMAIFRPHPDSPNRPIFNAAHFTVGTVAHVAAAVTMFLGTRLTKADMSDWAQWIVLGIAIWHCIVEIVLTTHQWHMNKQTENKASPLGDVNETYESIGDSRKDSNDYTPRSMTTTISKVELVMDQKQQSEQSGSVFKTVVIAVHFIVLLTCSIALVVDLA